MSKQRTLSGHPARMVVSSEHSEPGDLSVNLSPLASTLTNGNYPLWTSSRKRGKMLYVSAEWEAFVHLAYLDESGTDGHSPVVMFGAVIVPTGRFGHLEALHDTAIQQILPLDKIEDFAEFHAHDLYMGTGAFADIDPMKRFTAISVLLMTMTSDNLWYVYSAVDRKRFQQSPFGSGKPLHTAFHMCLLGVEEWARTNHPNPGAPNSIMLDYNDTCLYILDDCDDKALKEQFRRTYRTLRVKRPLIPLHNNRLWHAHDDMFFGDSRDSVGSP